MGKSKSRRKSKGVNGKGLSATSKRTLKNIGFGVKFGVKTAFIPKKRLTPQAKKLLNTSIGSKDFQKRKQAVKKAGLLKKA